MNGSGSVASRSGSSKVNLCYPFYFEILSSLIPHVLSSFLASCAIASSSLMSFTCVYCLPSPCVFKLRVAVILCQIMLLVFCQQSSVASLVSFRQHDPVCFSFSEFACFSELYLCLSPSDLLVLNFFLITVNSFIKELPFGSL